jgi:hypothetical protein
MRKFALLLTIGLFLSATTANATDGTKTTTKSHKGKKTAVCTGHCTGKCSGHCTAATGTKASSIKSGCSNPSCSQHGGCASKTTAEKN